MDVPSALNAFVQSIEDGTNKTFKKTLWYNFQYREKTLTNFKLITGIELPLDVYPFRFPIEVEVEATAGERTARIGHQVILFVPKKTIDDALTKVNPK